MPKEKEQREWEKEESRENTIQVVCGLVWLRKKERKEGRKGGKAFWKRCQVEA